MLLQVACIFCAAAVAILFCAILRLHQPAARLPGTVALLVVVVAALARVLPLALPFVPLFRPSKNQMGSILGAPVWLGVLYLSWRAGWLDSAAGCLLCGGSLLALVLLAGRLLGPSGGGPSGPGVPASRPCTSWSDIPMIPGSWA